jgi:hypothetical protein
MVYASCEKKEGMFIKRMGNEEKKIIQKLYTVCK